MKIRLTISAFAASAGLALADLTLDAGVTEIFTGTASAEIAVQVFGGDAISDMVGAVQVVGATITGTSFTGSVWESATGGFLDTTIGFPAPGETIDPNVSVLVPGETVAGSGTLLTFSVDTSSLPAGDYPIRLTTTPAGDTSITTTNGQPVETTSLGGVLRIVDKPLVVWRAANFPGDVDNSGLEATVWGDIADPDGDSILNFVEYAFGLPPNSATRPATALDAPGLPSLLTVQDGGQTYLAVRYTRRTDRPCHTVVVETSSDLNVWDDTGAALVQVGAPSPHPGGMTEAVTERLTTPIGFRMQVRVRVTTVDP